ncbi:MAG: isoprenyl transferase [Cyclobacteriaceae bacterium]|nr:isoprenyl transferase [Cyclobacteriaceae bacterium]
MDGNGRWAKKKGAARIFGHRNAISAVRDTVEGCAELGVEYLTLYAFSTENWGRPKEEVDGLMELLIDSLRKELSTLMKNNIRLKTIGNISQLPGRCHKELQEDIEASESNTGLTLILALNYSGRSEIVEAVKAIADEACKGGFPVSEIDDKSISHHLFTSEYPDPELLIRTSGELRLSNFLLWQLAYTELYFTDVLWPDFRKEHLHEALKEFNKRERRFGKTSEQLI